MTDKDITHIVLIGTATMVVAIATFFILYVRFYNKRIKAKRKKLIHLEIDDVLPDFKLEKRQLFCRCLYEIENKLPRTMFCFMQCEDQIEILAQRNKEKK